MSKQTPQSRILKAELQKNPNPEGYKMCIREVLKGIENRAYWYYTAEQAEFLNNVYTKEVEEETLRDRLKQITDDAMDQLFGEIQSGTVTKVALEHDSLTTEMKILEKVQDIASSGHQYYSPNHPTTKLTQERIKDIQEDYRSFKDKVEKIKQKQKLKRLEKESIEREIKSKIEEEKKLEYHKEVMKRMQVLRIKEQQRSEQNQKFKAFLKDYKKSKPLHMLMEQEYKQKIQLPQLEQSRKKLQLFKGKKKPTLEQINDHERAYMTTKQRRIQRKSPHYSVDVGYKSHFYKEIQQQERERADDSYSSMIWDQLEKKKRYSVMVKEQYKPKTSRVLHSSIEESQTRSKMRKVSPDLSRIKEVGMFYLEYMKSLQKNRTISHAKDEDDQKEQSRLYQSRYTNYLEDMKHSHEGRLKGLGSNWQSDMKDRAASKSQKRDRVMIKSKMLEEQAMRQEVFIKNQSHSKPQEVISKKKQVDETLLEAIKAKMALLKDAKEDD